MFDRFNMDPGLYMPAYEQISLLDDEPFCTRFTTHISVPRAALLFLLYFSLASSPLHLDHTLKHDTDHDYMQRNQHGSCEVGVLHDV
jgi:hypothetical protein